MYLKCFKRLRLKYQAYLFVKKAENEFSLLYGRQLFYYIFLRKLVGG